MITLEDIKALRKEQFDKSLALIDVKGHDYNRSQQESGDTLFNLRVAAKLGVVDSPARSVLVRMIDKVMRMISLTDADPAVKGESIADTVADLHNYADYWLAFKQEEAGKGVKLNTGNFVSSEDLKADAEAQDNAVAMATIYTEEAKYCTGGTCGGCRDLKVKDGGH